MSGDEWVAVIIEDDPDVRDLIDIVLTQSGFRTVVTSNGPAGVEAVRAHNPLITTLDVNMPGMDGFAVAKRLREFSSTYLIMITALADEIDVVQGFEAGADDYLVKPFRPRELRARADSMLRRPRARQEVPSGWTDGAAPAAVAPALPAQPAPPVVAVPPGPRDAAPVTDGSLVRFNGLELDKVSRVVRVDQAPVDLTRTEFDLLAALASRPGRVLQRETLLREVWQTDWEGNLRLVEAHMSNLRRKLQAAGLQTPEIKTVRGVGYRLVA